MPLFLVQSLSFNLPREQHRTMQHRTMRHVRHTEVQHQLKQTIFRRTTTKSMHNASAMPPRNVVEPATTHPMLSFLRRIIRSIIITLVSVLFCSFSSVGPHLAARAASGSSFSGSTFPSSMTSRRYSERSTKQSQSSFGRRRSSYELQSTQPFRSRQTAHSMATVRPSAGSGTFVVNRPFVIVQIAAIVGVTMFLAPHAMEVVLAKSGIKAATVSEVQYLLRLSCDEMAGLINSLQQILANDGLGLTTKMEAVSATLLRQQSNIVGGGMRQLRLKYEGGFQTAQNMFERLSMTERVKFSDEPTGGMSTSSSSSCSSSSSVSAVVTVLLLTRGPVLRNRGWGNFAVMDKRTQILKREHLVDFLFRLTGYVRTMDVRQHEYFVRCDRLQEVADSSPPGLEVKVLWTPNRSTETINESELRELWPSIRTI